MGVASTKKSSMVRTSRGNLLPPSEQAVAPRSTAIGRPSCDGFEPTAETVTALAAILAMFLRNTMNEDVVAISFLGAKKMCMEQGVSEKEFNRIEEKLRAFWQDRFDRNPLASMFRR